MTRLLFTPETRVQFEWFQELERERILNPRPGRPHGLRVSTECGPRRVKEFFDDFYRAPIDEGDADRGHEMESRFRALLLYPYEHTAQVTVPWELGTTAFDFEVREWTVDGEHPDLPLEHRMLELKSSIADRTAQSAHRGQVERMLTLAGKPVGSEVDIYMLHPGNYRVFGPFTHTLTMEASERCHVENAAVAEAVKLLSAMERPHESDEFNSREWWLELGLECCCGGCTPHTKLDANAGLQRLGFRYELALDRARAAAEAAGGADVKVTGGALREQLLNAARDQLRLAGDTKGKVTIYGTDYEIALLVQDTKDDGSVKGQIRPKYIAADEAAA